MVNPVFAQFQHLEEQDMYDSLITEAINNFGLDVQYLPIRAVLDRVLGENRQVKFDKAYNIEMRLINNDTFDNSEDVLEKFGLDIRQTFQFMVSITRFRETIELIEEDISRPREGDLIFVPMDSSLYEITKVREYEKYFRWGRLYTYNLTCELFRYSGQKFETGIPQIDEYNDKFSSEPEVSLEDLLRVDPIATNDQFTEEALELLDFDESNPFGNPE